MKKLIIIFLAMFIFVSCNSLRNLEKLINPQDDFPENEVQPQAITTLNVSFKIEILKLSALKEGYAYEVEVFRGSEKIKHIPQTTTIDTEASFFNEVSLGELHKGDVLKLTVACLYYSTVDKVWYFDAGRTTVFVNGISKHVKTIDHRRDTAFITYSFTL